MSEGERDADRTSRSAGGRGKGRDEGPTAPPSAAARGRGSDGPGDGTVRRGPEAGFGPDVADEADRPPLAPEGTGAGLERANLAGTVVLVVAAVAGAAAPETFTAPLVVVALVMLLLGTVAFLWAYAIAIGRSRFDAIGMGGLFFLSGSAPRSVQRRFLTCLGVQVVVSIAAAAVRPFTPVAFAVLAPMFGLGLNGLWAARHGAFPPRLVGRGIRAQRPSE